MKGATIARLAAAGAVWIACGTASAVNVLSNPDFATSTAAWTLEDPPNSTLAWSPVDANGAPGSGSALVTNTSAGPSNGTGIIQCVTSVTVGASYTFGGKVLYNTGQATTGSMQVGLRWRAGPGCTGATVGSQPRLSVNAPGAAWVSLASAIEVAPVGTVSADFIAFPSKVEAGGQLAGQFDDLYFDNGISPPPPLTSSPIPLTRPAILMLMAIALAALGVVRLRKR
jgi:hypothetical protein